MLVSVADLPLTCAHEYIAWYLFLARDLVYLIRNLTVEHRRHNMLLQLASGEMSKLGGIPLLAFRDRVVFPHR